MFDFMLDAAANIRQVPHGTISEKLAVGGEVSLRGMGTVFAVLILIWFLVELLHLLLGEKTKKAEPQKEVIVESIAKVENDTPAIEPEVVTVAPAAPDYELIAVITAAVAAASGSSPNSFRVVSFKRANNKFSSGK